MSLQPPFNLGQALSEAVALHRQGRLRDAEKIYTRVLKAAPDQFRCAQSSRRRQGAAGPASARRTDCSAPR